MKKVKVLGLIAVSAVLLTGCMDSVPELTDEQSEMISEYSASLLLKYSPNYNYRLVDDEALATALVQEVLLQEAAQTEQTAQTDDADGSGTQNEEGSSTEQNAEGTGQNGDSEGQPPEETQTGVEIIVTDEADIAELLGIDDVEIKYQSFELRNSYPEGNNGFSLTAAQGKTLLIVHFDIESASGNAAECDLFDYNLNIRMNVNGSSVKVLSTLLPNDIASYIETIPAGEVREVVAVAQVNDISDSEIESLSLRISSVSGSFDVKLR